MKRLVPTRIALVAVGLLSLLLTGCPPPSARRYLEVSGELSCHGHPLMDSLSAAVRRELKIPEVWHRNGNKWLCLEFRPRPLDIALYIYQPSNQVFIVVTDETGNHFSAQGREVFARVQEAIGRAVKPALARETTFEALHARLGDEIFGRCK